MKCPNCGSDVEDNFCPSCGALVAGHETETNIFIKFILKKWWLWLLICLAAVTAVILFKPDKNESGETLTTTSTTGTAADKSDNMWITSATVSTTDAQYDNLVKVYDLSAGIYTAGVDLPAGKCNIAALSGKGNLYSSNSEGGINELFGIDDGSGSYKESFYGLQLPKNSSLTVTSSLKIKLYFTSTESGYIGRSYDETAVVTLSGGKYKAGIDFSSGIYKVTAESGSGTVYSSNSFGNGINELLGTEDGSGAFNDSFQNVELPDGTELTISEGLTVKLVPAV